MKPPNFSYVAPETLQEALDLAAFHQDDCKLLAGGQSLMPALSFRLARPAVLIDLNRVSGLDGVYSTAAGGLAIRALTRHRAIERSAEIVESCPLMSAAMPHIAHVQVRNRGTIGGSLVHADPAAELAAIVIACSGELVVAGHRLGERVIPAEDFFLGIFTVALEPDDILTEIRLPPWPNGRHWGFQEIARRHGDFAIAGAAVWLDFSAPDSATCSAARIVVFGVGATPVRAVAAEQYLAGRSLSETHLREAGRLAASILEPSSDLHASAEYRREVADVMVRRALTDAIFRSRKAPQHESGSATTENHADR